MRVNRREGQPVVFIDETWCNAHDEKLMNWVELDPVCKGGTIIGPAGFVSYHCIFTNIRYSKPSGKGERLIIQHADGKDGWIDGARRPYKAFSKCFVLSGCDWVFKSKKESSDYHGEMNATSFEEWFTESVPKVMDNVSYHRYHEPQ